MLAEILGLKELKQSDMKICTNIEQSKKLAKILPIESADMRYAPIGDIHPWVWEGNPKLLETDSTPCWSLAALLDIIPYTIYKSDNEFYRLEIDKGYNDYAIWYSNNGLTVNDLDVTSDNFVDACVAMVEKLHEQNLL